MKRSYLLLSTIFTILVTLFSLVTPALAKEPRSIKLLSVEYWGGKGVVFKFQIKGDFSPSELKGFVRIGDKEFGLDCNFSDDDVLACVAGDGIGKYVGANTVIVVGGFGFYAQIPPKKQFGGHQYCYDIEGLMINESYFGPDGEYIGPLPGEGNPLPFLYPAVVGKYCTDYQPKTGDFVDFEHPQEALIENIFGAVGFFPEGDLTTAIFFDTDIKDLIPEPSIFESCVSNLPAYYGIPRLLLTCSVPK